MGELLHFNNLNYNSIILQQISSPTIRERIFFNEMKKLDANNRPEEELLALLYLTN